MNTTKALIDKIISQIWETVENLVTYTVHYTVLYSMWHTSHQLNALTLWVACMDIG